MQGLKNPNILQQPFDFEVFREEVGWGRGRPLTGPLRYLLEESLLILESTWISDLFVLATPSFHFVFSMWLQRYP